MMKYHRTIERLLPLKTRRRHYYDLWLLGLRALANEGWKSFLWKFKSYVKKNIDETLIYGIDSDLSYPIDVERDSILIRGWCYHPKHNIKKLYILLDGNAHKVSNFSNIRFDVFQHKRDPNSINSGFWTIIQPHTTNIKSSIGISIYAILDNGKHCEFKVGTLKVKPLPEDKMLDKKSFHKEKSGDPLVTICMATYNPPIDLFKRQINSIIRQSYKNWICIINDDCSQSDIFEKMKKVIASDNRFRVYQNSSNLGFYYNFERCLSRARVIKESEYVAFSDQDDFWHEDKLDTCLSEFDDDTTLVYSDMNIVDSKGKLIYNTYWTICKNNYKELDHLLLANTVTGAASVFRSDLLDTILPFPEKIGNSYHDWWVACVALAKGRIKYIDRPLYDYTQHSKNVLGYFVGQNKQTIFVIENLRTIFNLKIFLFNIQLFILNNLYIYNNDFIRIVLVANTLRLRCADASPNKLSIINQFSGFESSINGLLYQFIKGLITRRSTLDMLRSEEHLLRGILTNKLVKLYIKIKIFNWKYLMKD